MPYEQRTYRQHSSTDRLISFIVSVKETDLFISAASNLEQEARDAILKVRTVIEDYIKQHPDFYSSLTPLPFDKTAPVVIKKMLEGSSAADVGPMAAVAGAVAEFVGNDLLKQSNEILVENGGDIFLKVQQDVTISIFAGTSPLSEKVGIKIKPAETPAALCTSSGIVGPSLSFGRADAVTIKSSSAALADAAATAIGNLIKKTADITNGIDKAQSIPGIDAIVIIKDDKMGAWGDIELVKL